MKDWLEKVAYFNKEVIKLPEPGTPQVLNGDRLDWFIGAVHEELGELEEAVRAGDIAEAADAIVDMIYFGLGRLYEMGIPADVIFGDVHEANMKKVRGRKLRKIQHDADATKPEEWVAPDHSWLAFLSPVAIEAAKLLAKKSADYQGKGSGINLQDYFPFGMLSHAQMIWVKALRINSLSKQIYDAQILGKDHVAQNESLRDSLIDLHNYVDFAAEDPGGTNDK
jgi:NTP pyrophosphatase (non-canonical NTP hydrolase)